MEIERNKMMPGSTVDSWCGKCKLVLAHTIEAMVGDKPARVHCNTCKSQHAYKAHAPGRPARQSQPEGQTPPAEPRAPKARMSRFQSLLKGKDMATTKSYSSKNTYSQGDVFDHPIFGLGVTTAVKDGTKIEVLFETGSKVLIHGR
jgi:hypothetical protein